MSSNNSSSFKNKQPGKFIKLKGTKASHHNAQLLISSGVPSLDHICGGGLAVGSLFLIEEDNYARYSKLLLKYFFSEGAVCGHDLFVASGSTPPDQLIKELPGLVQNLASSTDLLHSNPNVENEKMKIAWRYQNLESVKSSVESSSFGHFYDLSQNLDSEHLKSIKISQFDPLETEDNIFEHLYNKIKHTIDSGNFKPESMDSNGENSVLRIGINSFGSALWSNEDNNNYVNSLPLFLMRLKALMRASFAVAVVTIPVELLMNFESSGCIRKLEQIADNVIHLESFMGSDKEQNPVFKDYHGLFHAKKLCRINSLCCHIPHAFDLAFKLKKKAFAIETLHLPPDLSETVSRTQGNAPAMKPSCSAAASQGYDF